MSEAKLGLIYTIGIFPAMLCRVFATRTTDLVWLNVPAGLAALVAVSMLFTVITFYRDDDLLLAGVLLAAITSIGTAIAFGVVSVLVTGSIGTVVFIAAGGFLVLVLRLVVLVPVMAGAVWVFRHFRRFLAPDTLEGRDAV